MPAKCSQAAKRPLTIEEIRHNLARLYGPTGGSKDAAMRHWWAMFQELPAAERDIIESVIQRLINGPADMGCGSAFLFVTRIARHAVMLDEINCPQRRGFSPSARSNKPC